MAKGQLRSNREKKKPKQPKKAAVPLSSGGGRGNAVGSRVQQKERAN